MNFEGTVFNPEAFYHGISSVRQLEFGVKLLAHGFHQGLSLCLDPLSCPLPAQLTYTGPQTPGMPEKPCLSTCTPTPSSPVLLEASGVTQASVGTFFL